MVPQGSTLGPLLFLLYINELYNSTTSLLTLFADDTCWPINANSLSNPEQNINAEVKKILNWVNASQLTINLSKSNLLIVPSKLNCTHNSVAVTINSTPVKIAKETKDLGIIVENKLTFGPHITYLESKFSRVVGILSKL